jgi:hypothetical protein
LLPRKACRRQIFLPHVLMMNSSTKSNLNVGPSRDILPIVHHPAALSEFRLHCRLLFAQRQRGQVGMRELSCVIVPNSRGWLLVVGAQRRGWFASRDAALRAAIVEAQRGRAAGFYSSVKVRSVESPSAMRTEHA